MTNAPTVLLHVPHASRAIPPEARASIALSNEDLEVELLRMTDHFTDELFDLGDDDILPVVFPVSRLIVDPERFIDDSIEPMAQRGMGVLYTHTSRGAPLRPFISALERESLLSEFYHPHHARLTEAVHAAVADHGSCLVLDCHSFSSVALPHEFDQAADRPEICIGTDPFHTPPRVTTATCEIFQKSGFTVALNRPFSGALVPMSHFGQDARVMALMVEVNRGVYMDEHSGERLPSFSSIRQRLQAAVRDVISAAAHMSP